MNTLIFSLLRKIVNEATVGKVVRNVVGPIFGFLAAWFAVKLPMFADFFSDFNAGLVATAITSVIMTGWSLVETYFAGPTVLQTEKVMTIAVDKGALTPAKAADVKSAVDDSIK